MQILRRSDIYLLALLLPFNVLLTCKKNIELAIIIAFGLLLMTPKSSLAVILSTASSTNLSMMQNGDESKQLFHSYGLSEGNSSWSNKQVGKSGGGSGGLIRCSNKLKCFDLNSSVLRMRHGGQLSGKDDNTFDENANNLYEGKLINLRPNVRARRDATSVIDTPTTTNTFHHQQKRQQKYTVQEQLMKNIAQERPTTNQRTTTTTTTGSHEDLIKLKISLEDLQQQRNNSGQGKETSVDNTHSSYNGFLKLIFFISIIFVILLIIIASIIYIWVIRRFSTNLEQVNRRLPEVNHHNLLNQDFEALMLSVQNLGCAGMERLGSPPSSFAASCSPQRDNRSIRRPTTIPIMQHDLKVSSNRQNNNSTKAQQQQQQSCYNNFNSGINNNNFSSSHQQHQQQHLPSEENYHRNNHQYTSCAPSNNCPTHIPLHDGEFNSRRIPSLDQYDEIRRSYIQGPPNKTIQDVPDAFNSHLPAYASSLRYNNNLLSNQKPSNIHNHHNSVSSGSNQCRNEKMRKTSSNFLLDKLKFLRANSSVTSTKSNGGSGGGGGGGGGSSVDYKAVPFNSAMAAPTSINSKSNNPMVHSTFPITSMSTTAVTSIGSSGMRCAMSQQQQQQHHSTQAIKSSTEELTDRKSMFNGSSTNMNFSSTNLQVSLSSSSSSSSSASSRSLLSQTLSCSSDCPGDTTTTTTINENAL